MHHHDAGCFVHAFPFSAPCDDMLAMLVCATCWLSLHLCTLVHMFMHESCLLMCRPCFNTLKLWTSDLNLHLSLADTPFCVFSLLVCPLCLLVSFLAFVTCYACHIYLACLLCILMLLSTFFPSVVCLLVFLSLPLHVHMWSKDA